MISAALALAIVEPALVPVCRGSGAYIASDRILTAYHVVASPDCILLDGKVIMVDKENDVAVIETTRRRTSFLRIACKPSREALTASHHGYAYSVRFLGGDAFEGRAYPGMSGAPIVNGNGEVFAIVTRGPAWTLDTFFRNDFEGGMLKRTTLCGGKS